MNQHVPPPDARLRWLWSLDDLLRMVEAGILDANEKIELIDGEIVPMQPKGRRHESLADELARYWGPKVTPDIWVSVERQFNLDPYTYANPDLVVRPGAIKSYDLRGDTALLVVESADTSLGYDLGTKARVYAKFGVREYWVTNARVKSTRIHRAPVGDGYTEVREAAATETLPPLLAPQLAVRLADLDLE